MERIEKIEYLGNEKKKLRIALMSAYPKYSDVNILVSDCFETPLNTFTSEIATHKQIVFELIEWAIRKNKLEMLIWEAFEENLDNLELRKIVYEICFVTKSQWNNLCDLLKKVYNKSLIKVACQKTFAKPLIDRDPRLLQLTRLDNFTEIEAILRQNLITNKEKGNMKIPSIVEFAHRLSVEKSQDIYNIRNSLNEWVQTIANQLEIQIPTETTFLTQSKEEEKHIQPYLLIVLEEILNNEILLRAEVIIKDQNQDKNLNLEEKNIYSEKGKIRGIKVKKSSNCKDNWEKIGSVINDILSESSKYVDEFCQEQINCFYFQEKFIIELFLPSQYFVSIDINDLIININGRKRKIISEYMLNFRCLNRWIIYKENNQFLISLKNNWKKLNRICQVNNKKDLISKNFEYYVYKTDECLDLERSLKSNKEKVALTVVSPLERKNTKFIENIMFAATICGIPFSIWTVNEYLINNKDKISCQKLECYFKKFLLTKLDTNFNNFINRVIEYRRQIYDYEKTTYFGYGLLFSSENPELVPSDFDDEFDDALTMAG